MITSQTLFLSASGGVFTQYKCFKNNLFPDFFFVLLSSPGEILDGIFYHVVNIDSSTKMCSERPRWVNESLFSEGMSKQNQCHAFAA